MLALIVMVAFGLVLTFFALENTNLVTISVANYVLTNIPLYMVVLGSVLFGLFVGWVMSLLESISTSLTLRGKESVIKNAETSIERLENKIHELEMENVRLKEHSEPMLIDQNNTHEEEYRPNFFERLLRRPHLAQ